MKKDGEQYFNWPLHLNIHLNDYFIPGLSKELE
jgi:hypothetical protein